MSLNKHTYESISTLIDQEKYDELETYLASRQNELLTEYVQIYTEQKFDTLQKDLRLFAYIEPILQNSIKNWLSYRIGYICAIFKLLESLLSSTKKRDNLYHDMILLYNKANVAEILHFLLHHPDSQHKVIAEHVGIKANYLSQLMRELEQINCVIRYGTGKRSFYSLSPNGLNFVRQKEASEPVPPAPYKYSMDKYRKTDSAKQLFRYKTTDKYTVSPSFIYPFKMPTGKYDSVS